MWNKRRWPRCGHGRRSWGDIASVIAIAIVNANTNPDGGADRASGECSGPGSYYYATSTARDSAEPRYNKSATQRSDCPTCNRTEDRASPSTDSGAEEPAYYGTKYGIASSQPARVN